MVDEDESDVKSSFHRRMTNWLKMRDVKIARLLSLIYCFQIVQTGRVKYMPLGYDSKQDQDCLFNERDTKPKVMS